MSARSTPLLGVERCCYDRPRPRRGRPRCRLYVVDGYGDDAVLERMIGFWLALPSTADAADAQTFIDRYVTFSEVNAEADLRQTATACSSANAAPRRGLRRMYPHRREELPLRGVEEPSSGKVLRGRTTASSKRSCRTRRSLRRRIRTPQLTLGGHKISEKSRADVVLCYLEDKGGPRPRARPREARRHRRGLHLHVAGVHRGIHDGSKAMVQPFFHAFAY